MTTESAFSILNWMTLVLCVGMAAIAIIIVYNYLFDRALRLLRLKGLFYRFLVARRKAILARRNEAPGPHPVETCGCPICTKYRETGEKPQQELPEDQSSEDGCNDQ